MSINVDTFKPLGDRVLIERNTEIASQGGIILTESSQEKQQSGKVIAVGPGKYNTDGTLQAMQVAVGNEVFFAQYSGIEFNTQDTQYVVMREEDIVAVTA